MGLSRFSLKKLGPGMMYAGAAIGVSHLVQSTRAGAQFGFELVYFVILANILKYPFLEVAQSYSGQTGRSLLTGYKKVGKWQLPTFLVITALTMWIIQSAIFVVTTGILANLFGIQLSVQMTSIGLICLSCLILFKGGYKGLSNFIKYLVIGLSLTALLTLVLSLFFFKGESLNFWPTDFQFSNQEHMLFLMALVGWMPAPLDISVWQSIWICEKQNWKPLSRSERSSGNMDFEVGYWSTAVLAMIFLGLGAVVMKSSGEAFSGSAVGFAGQLVSLFTQQMGSWSYPIIGFACFATMLSTSLTCLDAFARVASYGYQEIVGGDAKGLESLKKTERTRSYRFGVLLTAIGSGVVIVVFLKNMKSLVDFATIVSFLVTPIIAFMNTQVDLKLVKRDGSRLKRNFVSVVSIGVFGLFSLYFLYLRFFS